MSATNENAAPQRVSGLRPPSKIALPSSASQSSSQNQALHEISDVDQNARAQLPASSISIATTGLKHKPSGLPESAAKRKMPASSIPTNETSLPSAVSIPTASAPAAHQASIPSSKTPANNTFMNFMSGYGKPPGASTATGLSHFRNSSYSSSGSSSTRYSRNTSGSSFASSVGPPPISRNTSGPSASRPASSISYGNKNICGPSSSLHVPRLPPSFDSQNGVQGEELSSLSGKRQGTNKLSSSRTAAQDIFPRDLRPSKQRRRNDSHTDKVATRAPSRSASVMCDVLISPTAFVSSSSFVRDSTMPFRDLNTTATSLRNPSISTCMEKLSLQTHDRTSSSDTAIVSSTAKPNASEDLKQPATPSYIPIRSPARATVKGAPAVAPAIEAPCNQPPPSSSVSSSCKRYAKHGAAHSLSPVKLSKQTEMHVPFLNRFTNCKAAWDTEGRLQDMEVLYGTLKEQMETSTTEKTNIQEQMNLYKTRINELESIRSQLTTTNTLLQSELEGTKTNLNQVSMDFEASRRAQGIESDDMRRKHRNEMEDVRDEHRRELERTQKENQEELDRVLKTSREEYSTVDRRLRQELDDERLKRTQEVESEREKRVKEVQELNTQLALERQGSELDAGNRDRENARLKNELSQAQSTIEQERALNSSLREKLGDAAAEKATLEALVQALQAEKNFLKSDSQAQSQAFADLNQKTQEAIAAATEAQEKLRKEETLRRKLHNQIQELKGNIRVFCRVRPTLDTDVEETAKISFPDNEDDCKEVVVMGPEQQSALGKITQSKNPFSFDRVFDPSSGNGDVFEEISQLVQSALDGYNVCIFCYGQTGSGKTYTMSAEDGMIPLAVHQIYDTAKSLEAKGWRYTMEGSFVEVYNENLNDLLGKSEDLDKKKLEIRHDLQTGKTTITDVNTVTLDSPSTVAALLKRATANRSVAATKANERSSRSHSVFILKLTGENSVTGERSEGTLNLVDLAGSERLAHSGATGDRLKETQNINRSLSCLGDVIGALGQGKEGAHIPYRNSKLTYLLQNSLGGNSKTLMFVMISPLHAHLSETLTSLKFATKVHNTHIGSAKRTNKVKE